MYNQPQLLNKTISLNDIKIRTVFGNGVAYPEREFDIHIHNFYEAYINVSGDVSFLINENLVDVKPGVVIFAKPEEVHHCVCNAPSVHGHYCLWFLSDDPTFESYVKDIETVTVLSEENKEMVFSLLNKLIEKREIDNDFESLYNFFSILNLLKNNDSEEQVQYKDIPFTLSEIIKYINKNYINIKNILC